MPAGACAELGAEPHVVVAVDRGHRGDPGGGQPREHVLQVVEVRDLHDVPEHEHEIDPLGGEPCERRVGELVQALGRERVEPAGAGRAKLAVQVAEDADAHQPSRSRQATLASITSVLASGPTHAVVIP